MSDKKICHNCSAENAPSATFCGQCGQELSAASVTVCPTCRYENPADASFCGSCGSVLKSEVSAKRESSPSRRKTNSSQSKPSRKSNPSSGPSSPRKRARRQAAASRWNGKTIAWLAVGGAFVLLYFVYVNHRADKIVGDYVEQRTANVALENEMHEIASKFVCACGSCPNNPLESCGCVTARRERDYIRTALNAGLSGDEVIRKVNAEFGGLEDEFEAEYGGSGKVRLDLTSTDPLNAALAGEITAGMDDERIAGFVERAEIISHFTCNCGQCDMDQLSECGCDPPGGATEVKGFIDDRIAEGGLTVGQIIEQVDNRYGGKIR